MKHVLFVDDDKNVLSGLRRMLRGIRKEWDMDFAPGGAEALDMLEEKEYDLVISDMRMPGMDGAQLLQKVQERSPETVRIILSGHSEPTVVMRSVRTAHQFLSKPCSSEQLLKTLEDSYRLRQLLSNPRIKAAISGVETLPSIPDLYDRILREIERPGSSLDEVGEIIAEDVGMTAMILKMVNSSFFGFFREITTPGQAVSLLGVEVVKALVLSAHLFSSFDAKKAAPSFSMAKFRSHSLMVSKLSEAIAEHEGRNKQEREQCSVAGMLHDMGKLLLSTQTPTQYEEILSAAGAADMPEHEAEQRLLQTTHGEVGAYLLGLWGVHGEILESVAFHHVPGTCPSQAFTPLAAVHAADYFEHKHLDIQGETACELNMQFLEQCGLAHRVPQWDALCSRIIEEVKANDE